MKSRTTERFREAFEALPVHVQRQAREAYRQFARDPYHPSLRFKPVHARRPIYAVRIGRDYRALGIRQEDEVLWFWIGPHREYETLLARL